MCSHVIGERTKAMQNIDWNAWFEAWAAILGPWAEWLLYERYVLNR